MRTLKAIVEKHTDGYVAYPLGIKGVVVGQGDTCAEALEDLRSAISFHIESFGSEMMINRVILDAVIADVEVP